MAYSRKTQLVDITFLAHFICKDIRLLLMFFIVYVVHFGIIIIRKGVLVISYFISSIIFKYLIIDESKFIYF